MAYYFCRDSGVHVQWTLYHPIKPREREKSYEQLWSDTTDNGRSRDSDNTCMYVVHSNFYPYSYYIQNVYGHKVSFKQNVVPTRRDFGRSSCLWLALRIFTDITFEATSSAYEKETDFILIRFTDRATGFVFGASSHCWWSCCPDRKQNETWRRRTKQIEQ